MTTRTRTAVAASIVGVLAVTLYATWAAVHILVINPLAAVPGTGLVEIYATMSDAGQMFSIGWVFAILGLGVVLAVAVAWVCIASKSPPVVAISAQLGLLVSGAPAYFIASFGPGMSLADTYLISGGSHSPWHLPLYAISALAAVAVIAIAIVVPMRLRSAPAVV
ncbi:hypothetical protein [Microbacterium sp. Bi121]|uniref:hypothetical protein n=1 Tax=Microbacterium sp. Bi121 TaxID=2822348 RepID=UPI001DD54518|nr:hypothetical protein [Microbacterium sp. Bi121]CAH0153767.1 hypothetical protein SRABI121_01324 [Microbacterium sp. Bi121]